MKKTSNMPSRQNMNFEKTLLDALIKRKCTV